MNGNNKVKVVIVGAGFMGTGIAHAFAISGFQTVLVDISTDSLDRAYSNITEILKTGVKLGKVTEEAADAALGTLTLERELSVGAKNADWVIETVSENLEAKKSGH